jgi:hypothetical protein
MRKILFSFLSVYCTVQYVGVYAPATVDYSTHYHGQPHARVGLNPMPEVDFIPQ